MILGGHGVARPAVVFNLRDEVLHALATNFVTGGSDGGERNVAAPGERVTVTTHNLDVVGHAEPGGLDARDGSGGEHVGERNRKVGPFRRGALGKAAPD